MGTCPLENRKTREFNTPLRGFEISFSGIVDCRNRGTAYNEGRYGCGTPGSMRLPKRHSKIGPTFYGMSAMMPSDNEKCANLAHEEAADGCRLSTLRKRSQLDFEIEFFERILSRDPNYVEVLINLGDLFTKKGCHRRALQVDLRLANLRPKSPEVFYNLACSYAQVNQAAQAIDALQQAVKLGFSDLDYLLSDPDLTPVRSHPLFQRLVADIATRPDTQHVI
jgi:tetratricopeptide (TPR) repeat protein